MMFRMLQLQRYSNSNYHTFQNLSTMNKFLQFHKFPYTVVYFSAKWNPQCTQSDSHAVRFASENPHAQLIKIDSDVAIRIAKHYRTRAEPEFVFCLYGDEVIRQIGLNYQGLVDKLKKTEKLAETQSFFGQEKWVPYGSKYQVYYEQIVNIRQQETGGPI